MYEALIGTYCNIDVFLIKTVPFSQILTKSYNPNTHFKAFFMLYTNQITKIKKKYFWTTPQWFRFKKKWPKFNKIEILIFGSLIYFSKTSISGRGIRKCIRVMPWVILSSKKNWSK
jgi:hypothetical protein